MCRFRGSMTRLASLCPMVWLSALLATGGTTSGCGADRPPLVKASSTERDRAQSKVFSASLSESAMELLQTRYRSALLKMGSKWRRTRWKAALSAARLADRLEMGQPVLTLLAFAMEENGLPGWARILEGKWRLRRALRLLRQEGPATALADLAVAFRRGSAKKRHREYEAQAHVRLAVLHLERGEAARAMDHFQKASKAWPAIRKPWWGLALKLQSTEPLERKEALDLARTFCAAGAFNLAGKAAAAACERKKAPGNKGDPPGMDPDGCLYLLECAHKGVTGYGRLSSAAALERVMSGYEPSLAADVLAKACRRSEDQTRPACTALRAAALHSNEALWAYAKTLRDRHWIESEAGWIALVAPRADALPSSLRQVLAAALDPRTALNALPAKHRLLRAEMARRLDMEKKAWALMNEHLRTLPNPDKASLLELGLLALKLDKPASAKAFLKRAVLLPASSGLPASNLSGRIRELLDLAVLRADGAASWFAEVAEEAKGLVSSSGSDDRLSEQMDRLLSRLMVRGLYGPAALVLEETVKKAGLERKRRALFGASDSRINEALARHMAFVGANVERARKDAVSRYWEQVVGKGRQKDLHLLLAAAGREKTTRKAGKKSSIGLVEAILDLLDAACLDQRKVKTLREACLRRAVSSLERLSRRWIRRGSCGIDETSPVLWLGRALKLDGKPVEAAQAVLSALQTGPGGFAVCRIPSAMGALVSLGFMWHAGQLAWNVAGRFSKDASLLMPAIRGLILSGRKDQAVLANDDLMASAPDGGMAHRKLVGFYLDADDLNGANRQALRFFESTGAPSPERIPMLRLAVLLMARSGSWDMLEKYVSLWRSQVRSRKDRKRLDLQLGLALLDAGSGLKAAGFLDRWPELMLRAEKVSGRLDRAASAAQRWAGDEPLNVQPLCDLAEIRMRQGRVDEARRLLDKALVTEKRVGCAQLGLAALSARMKQLPDAAAWLSVLLAARERTSELSKNHSARRLLFDLLAAAAKSRKASSLARLLLEGREGLASWGLLLWRFSQSCSSTPGPKSGASWRPELFQKALVTKAGLSHQPR